MGAGRIESVGRYLSCKNCEERLANLLVGCTTIDPLEQGINDLASKLLDSTRVRG